MNREDMFELLQDLDGRYITEVDRKKKHGWIKWLLVAAVIVIFIFAGCFILISNRKENAYKVIASEVGKEYMQLGATMPQILYCNDKKIIMYDYIGIWVYDFSKNNLVGYCDFRPLDMTQIQGYPYVCVKAVENGKFVEFYMSDNSKRYLYDVNKDEFKEVATYDEMQKASDTMPDVSADHSLSEYASTYQIADKTYISYTLNIEDSANEVQYKDLIILKETNGKLEKFLPFATGGEK